MKGRALGYRRDLDFKATEVRLYSEIEKEKQGWLQLF